MLQTNITSVYLLPDSVHVTDFGSSRHSLYSVNGRYLLIGFPSPSYNGAF